MIVLLVILFLLLPTITKAGPAIVASGVKVSATRTAPLTIEEVLARIELTHPLLCAIGTDRIKALAEILESLGAWEHRLQNQVTAERYTGFNLTGVPGFNQETAGFNDLQLVAGHPWGFKLVAGTRFGWGDPVSLNALGVIPDMNLFYPQNQMILGGSISLLRGLMINDEYLWLRQAELGMPLAEVHVTQERRDLYLAGAVQYWDWQVAVKQAEVLKRVLAVAEERFTQVEGLAKGGCGASRWY